MKIVRMLYLPLLLALALFVTAGCAHRGSDVLRVAVRDEVPGFGYLNPTSQVYSGMEIDLARRLGEALGYAEVEFIGVKADKRGEALDNGVADCVIATFSITPERAARYDFSSPYYYDSLRVLVEKSTLFESLWDIKGKTVGVAAGSTGALELALELKSLGLIPEFEREGFSAASFNGGVCFKEYQTYPELIEALEAGWVDAACADGCILSQYLTDERLMLPERFGEQAYGVCTPKGSQLTARVGAQIDEFIEDIIILALTERWELNEM